MTLNWRDRILEKFPPHVARLTLVADPDSLLTEEEIALEIQSRGFETLLYTDPISFRFIYESIYRPRRQSGEPINLIIVIQAPASEVDLLPYDLLQQSDRRLSFSLKEIFPTLSYSVISTLDRSIVLDTGDRSILDALYRATAEQSPQDLTDEATQDFILRHAFSIASETIQQLPNLLNCLLRIHYKGQQLPISLNVRLISILRQKPQFQTFPLESIVPNRQIFLEFLQDHWQQFVRQFVQPLTPSLVSDPPAQYLSPTNLPFDHKDVWAYMDNFFREGYLKPIDLSALGLTDFPAGVGDRFKIGVYLDSQVNHQYRFQRLLELVQSSIPDPNAHYRQWFILAYQWAELLTIWHQLTPTEQKELLPSFHAIQQTIDSTFLDWVCQRYNTLHNQSPVNPAMLHHIPAFLARQTDFSRQEKVALILMDGLAMDQWLVIRQELLEQQPNFNFKEDATFAWLPTITSVSRQAVFAGKPPIAFAGSIQTTSKEGSLWKQFWLDKGLTSQQIEYAAGLRDDNHISKIDEICSNPSVRVLGLVVDKIDRISHGKESGTPNMHHQIRPWVQQGFMTKLLISLLDNEFKVFLTADHGNIEATGMGRPSEGAIAEYRGERVRVYVNAELRAKINEKFPEAIPWNSPVLPANYFPLLAPNRSAFILPDEIIVAHGGISVEELIVPLVQIQRLG